jgi:hypothetical protein
VKILRKAAHWANRGPIFSFSFTVRSAALAMSGKINGREGGGDGPDLAVNSANWRSFCPRPPNLEAAGKTNPRPARLEFSILRVLDQDAVPKVDPVVLPALTANCDRCDDDPVGGAMRHAPQSHA